MTFKSIIYVICLSLLSKVYMVFTALHGMQTRSSDENSVHLSVFCLSNACTVTKWKKNLSRFLYHVKDL